MKPYVVTIARENGSGGRAIGHALARKLGVECYNRQMLRLASDESGINEQLFAQADEQFKKTLLFKVARDAYKGEVIPPDSDNFTSNENLFRYQARVIRQLCRLCPEGLSVPSAHFHSRTRRSPCESVGVSPPCW